MNEFSTIKELATIINVTTDTLRDMQHKCFFPTYHHKVSREYYYNTKDYIKAFKEKILKRTGKPMKEASDNLKAALKKRKEHGSWHDMQNIHYGRYEVKHQSSSLQAVDAEGSYRINI